GLDLLRPHPAQLGVVGAQGIGHGLAHDLEPPRDDGGRGLGQFLTGLGVAQGVAGRLVQGAHATTLGWFQATGKTSWANAVRSWIRAGTAASMMRWPFSGLAWAGSEPMRPSGKRAR